MKDKKEMPSTLYNWCHLVVWFLLIWISTLIFPSLSLYHMVNGMIFIMVFQDRFDAMYLRFFPFLKPVLKKDDEECKSDIQQ